jgi:hypothetical protein
VRRRVVRLSYFVAVLAMALTLAAMAEAPALRIRTVAPLDNRDEFPGLLFQSGRLWVGRTFVDGVPQNRADVFTGDDLRQVNALPLPHTPEHLYPWGKEGVLVLGYQTTFPSALQSWWIGKSAIKVDPAFSIFELKGTSYRLQSTLLPDVGIVRSFAGHPFVEEGSSRGGGLYFAVEGNSLATPRGTWKGGRKALSVSDMRVLAPVIDNIGASLLFHSSLYVVETGNDDLGDENLIKVSLDHTGFDGRQGEAYPVFPSSRQSISSIAPLTDYLPLRPGAKELLAFADPLHDRVGIVDVRTHTVLREMSVRGFPFAVARFAGCLVTLSSSSQTLTFHSLEDSSAEPVAVWRLTANGKPLPFPNPTTMVVDESNGRIFLRSNKNCPYCEQNVNGVIVVDEPSKATLAACQQKSVEGQKADK